MGEIACLPNSVVLKIKHDNIGKSVIIEHIVSVQQFPVITNIITL